jgi:predicted hexulose-6-phosphate isomerase
MPHDLSLPEKLVTAQEFGFDFLEVSIDESDEKLSRLHWSNQQRREVIEASVDHGISVGSMCLSGQRKYSLGSCDKTVRRISLDIMERAIDLACDWGIRIIQLAGYDVYYEPSTPQTRAYFMDNLTTSVDMAARSGVILAFETMETPFMDTVAKAMTCISTINSPYLQIYPDLGNLTNAALLYGHSVDDDLATGGGHLVALHLKETLPGSYRDVRLGTGHVDFPGGIRAAGVLGVRRFVGELWDDGDYKTQVAHAAQFLRGQLEVL